jgi:hypothetical protein
MKAQRESKEYMYIYLLALIAATLAIPPEYQEF